MPTRGATTWRCCFAGACCCCTRFDSFGSIRIRCRYLCLCCARACAATYYGRHDRHMLNYSAAAPHTVLRHSHSSTLPYCGRFLSALPTHLIHHDAFIHSIHALHSPAAGTLWCSVLRRCSCGGALFIISCRVGACYVPYYSARFVPRCESWGGAAH